MLEPMSEQVQGPPEPFTVMFRFDWEQAPLSLNKKIHWGTAAKIKRELRSTAHALARRIPPCDRIDVHLVWFVTTKRKRDGINVTPTLKALVDGLVDAEVIPDDTPEFLVDHIPEIRFIDKNVDVAHFELSITELPA